MMFSNEDGADTLFDESFLLDPYPTYAKLRLTSPVHWSEDLNCWLVTRHSDVTSLLPHRGLGARDKTAALAAMPPAERELFGRVEQFFSLWVAYSDPPRHATRRTAVKDPFSADSVRALTDRIQAAADMSRLDFVKTLALRPECLLAHYARPFSIRSTCALLGVREEDFSLVMGWCDELVGYFTAPGFRTDVAERAVSAIRRLHQYVPDRLEPDAPVARALLRADALDHSEVVALFAQILTGGIDPVSTAVTVAVHQLVTNRSLVRSLRSGALDMGALVSETLRFDSPFHFASRVARTDMQIDGKPIRAGQSVRLVLSSANRDETVFPSAGVFAPDRPEGWSRTLSFGRGPHHCLGSRLARLQITVAVTALVGDIEVLHMPHPPERRPSFGSTSFAKAVVGLQGR